jgi:peroxin-12
MEFFSDVGGDPLKPSLFELIAQEQLRDLLQPALKYVLSVWTDKHVSKHCGILTLLP